LLAGGDLKAADEKFREFEGSSKEIVSLVTTAYDGFKQLRTTGGGVKNVTKFMLGRLMSSAG